MSPVAVAVALVLAERLVELWFSARNYRALRAVGAVEHGRRHYPLFIALHGAWLGALMLAVPATRWPAPLPLALYLALQVVRFWAIASLGQFWTTRIVTLPGAPLIRRGPYRFLRHPNYAVVAAEIVLLPLAFGAYAIAALFGVANLALLGWRIGTEERALAPRRAV